MTKNLNIKFEKAVRLLTQHAPISDEKSRKPLLPHDIRVGVYLYEHNYSDEIILAGLLHDSLEFTTITEQILKEEFGDNIVKLVKANTKNNSIKDEEKDEELIKRCVKNGQEALIIKTADIIDSFKYYTAVENQEQLKYCIRNTKEIFKYKPDNFVDLIFEELKSWNK